MEAIRTEISGDYDFSFDAANIRILTGQEEGAFGWMAANFLAKPSHPVFVPLLIGT